MKIMQKPDLLVVGIDQIDFVDYSGRLWNGYQNEPEVFQNSLELIEEMEAFYDRLNYPERAIQYRSFSKRKQRTQRTANMEDRKPDMSKLEKKKGEKGTFIVEVMYRQNATWQGQVIWAEQNKSMYFRSAMELLKLMDSALNQSAAGQDPSRTSDADDREDKIGAAPFPDDSHPSQDGD